MNKRKNQGKLRVTVNIPYDKNNPKSTLPGNQLVRVCDKLHISRSHAINLLLHSTNGIPRHQMNKYMESNLKALGAFHDVRFLMNNIRYNMLLIEHDPHQDIRHIYPLLDADIRKCHRLIHQIQASWNPFIYKGSYIKYKHEKVNS